MAKMPRAREPKRKRLRPEFVRALRLSTGLSQSEAADVVHATKSAWQKWEGTEGKLNHRYPHEMAIDLFCTKQGLMYPPKFGMQEGTGANGSEEPVEEADTG